MALNRSDNGSASNNGHGGGWLSRLFADDSQGMASEQSYRRLALQLDLDLGQASSGRCVMLTSPHSIELICEATLGLARFLAEEMSQRVLVIDAGMGQAGIGAELGHAQEQGLLDLLRDGSEAIDNMTVQGGHENLWLLPPGRPGSSPLNRASLGRVIEKGRQSFDYVLVQAGPVLTESKSLIFPPLADRVLLLAVEGQTLLEDIDASYGILTDCRAQKVGLVLTQIGGRPLSRRWSRS